MKPYTLERITYNKDVIIVMLHGIIELPIFYQFIIDKLPENVSYVAPTLEGHALPSREFGKASMKIWEKQIDNLYEKYSKEYKKIIFVGHSLGTLLSITEANKHPDKIPYLLLLNCPLKIWMKASNLKTYLTVGFHKKDKIKDETIKHASDICGVELSQNPFSYVYWAKPFYSLLRGIKKGKKEIKKLKTTTIAFHADNDELVSKKTLKLLKENNNIKIHIMKNSSHYLYSDESKDDITKALIEMLNNTIVQSN